MRRISTVFFASSAAVLIALSVGAAVPGIWAPAFFVIGYALANEGK